VQQLPATYDSLSWPWSSQWHCMMHVSQSQRAQLVQQRESVALHDACQPITESTIGAAARSQRSNRDLAQTGADGSSWKVLHVTFAVALDRKVAELCDVDPLRSMQHQHLQHLAAILHGHSPMPCPE
jgi:hypothetical protein